MCFFAFFRLKNEISKDSAKHVGFHDFVSHFIGKTERNISPLIENNAIVTRTLAHVYGKAFICGHGHCFNLALQEALKTYSDAVNKIQTLISSFHVIYLLPRYSKNTSCIPSLHRNLLGLDVSYFPSIYCVHKYTCSH